MRKLTQEEFIQHAKKTHNERYDYSQSIYKNRRTKIKIICRIHGSFFQNPCYHTRGSNCPKCANITSSRKVKRLLVGKKRPEETKRKISKTLKGNIPWNKGKKGKNSVFYGKQHTEETKQKMRIAALKRIGQICPNYNKQACEYFKDFDKQNNTQGKYAVYGGNEYLIKKLGYYPDYINFDTKLIMEWDEPAHYVNGKLKQKDINRQKEIMEHYPDFKFKRVKQLMS